jgi:hypothetical protein
VDTDLDATGAGKGVAFGTDEEERGVGARVAVFVEIVRKGSTVEHVRT